MSNTLMTIPLCQLKRSKTNIRKTEPNADIEQLAASIEANGLLENLVVRREEASDSTETGSYEVVAGSRRLAALKLLFKRKKIARDHPVPCLVLEKTGIGDLVEVSLTENIVRAPVHPADQFDAFAKLQKEGLPAEDIAARFGISPNVVLQRLKLAQVSPRLMAEYRKGEVSLEQMMAFTISDDQKAQEETWFENPFGDRSPQAIRRFLTNAHVEGGDRRARFIGVKAYEEAGGIIIRDLFQPDEEGYFTDSQLLDRLVAEKLRTEGEKVKAEGWGWVDIVLETDFSRSARFGRVKPIAMSLSEEEEARFSALCDRYDELVTEIEEEGDEKIAAEFDQVSAELSSLQAKKEAWPEEEKGRAGVIISLDYTGKLQIDRGLVTPEDIKIAEQNDEGAPRGDSGPAKKKDKTSIGYSESVLLDLSAHRTAALREVLAGKPEKALVALLHALVGRIFFHGQVRSCFEITASTADPGKFSDTVGESKAAAALLARHTDWAERLPPAEELWEWLEGLSQSDQLDLLAYCTATTVNAMYEPGGARLRLRQADQLARSVGLDMADWWQPTHAGFFDRVTKDRIIRAVSEGVSQEAARKLVDRKKNLMGRDAETMLAGKRWLPEPLRTSSPVTGSETEAPAETAAE